MTAKTSTWPVNSRRLAKELHAELSLSEQNWHQLKGNSERRAAELISGALTQLLEGGKHSDIEAMTCQAIKWLKKELKDPGCPKHHSS